MSREKYRLNFEHPTWIVDDDGQPFELFRLAAPSRCMRCHVDMNLGEVVWRTDNGSTFYHIHQRCAEIA